MERVQQAFCNIDWASLDLQGTKNAAHFLMNQWTWQGKVPAYKQKVNEMTSKDDVISFMWNATNRGLQYKRRLG